ncbi:hypothetical protein [Caulobacter sp. DWR3-1-2]|uniref:hypothetical protein n=1 Tax=Caulobacter sp. DWR3-1-2 TaxID=2804647 RepID=UPI003CE708D9
MAEKRSDMSAEYYSHKRTTLLCSSVLFVLALPGVSIDNFKYADFMLKGLKPGFVLLALSGVAVYYFCNFMILWMHEAIAYLREERTGQRDLVEKIQNEVAQLKAFAQELVERAAKASDAVDWARSAMTSTSQDQQVSADDIRWSMSFEPTEEEKQSSFGGLMLVIGSATKRAPAAAAAIADYKDLLMENAKDGAMRLFALIYAKRYRPAVNRILGSEELVMLGQEAGDNFTKANIALEAATREIAKFRNDIAFGNWITRLRIFAIDLAAPVTLFVVAMAHALGARWPVWWDLPHQLAAAGILR